MNRICFLVLIIVENQLKNVKSYQKGYGQKSVCF